MFALEAIKLSKRFGKALAVDDVSFGIEPGQTFGFLGPNGSGKTTTIGMIVGIVAPTSGRVRLFGGESVKDLQRARRRIGGTLEQPNLYPYLTGWDNLRIVASIKGVDRKGIEQALNAVAMTDAAKYAATERRIDRNHAITVHESNDAVFDHGPGATETTT